MNISMENLGLEGLKNDEYTVCSMLVPLCGLCQIFAERTTNTVCSMLVPLRGLCQIFAERMMNT